MQEHAISAKLLPPETTPDDEICQHRETSIKLMSALSYNPFHCMKCNLEIPLNTLVLSLQAVELIRKEFSYNVCANEIVL